MKLTMVVTCLSLGLVASAASAQSTTSTPADKPTVNQRLENQKDRIQAGTKDDELTKSERTHLRANDAAIHAQERGVPARERRHAHQGREKAAQSRAESQQQANLSRPPQQSQTALVARHGRGFLGRPPSGSFAVHTSCAPPQRQICPWLDIIVSLRGPIARKL